MLDRKLCKIVVKAIGKSSLEIYPININIRIIVQKMLYLLTHSANNRINLLYKWKFWKRGSYSSSIAQQIYYINDLDTSAWKLEDEQLTNNESLAIRNFQDFYLQLNRLEFNIGSLMEAAATLIYCTNTLELKEGDEIYNAFVSFKEGDYIELNKKAINEILDLLVEFQYSKE